MKRRCNTPRCKREPYVKRRYCCTCLRRKAKTLNPVGYHFDALKQNAKRRGKEFTITLDQYREFATTHGLFDATGRKRTNRTIDRIDPDRGYHIDNIQVLTISENSRKKYVDYWQRQAAGMTEEELQKYRAYEDQLNADIHARRQQEEQLEDAPF